MTTLRSLAISLAGLLLLSTQPLVAQEPSDKQERADKKAEWPHLQKKDDKRVRALIQQFRKKKEALHKAAHKKLLKFGDSAAPVLISQVNDRATNVNEHLFGVLDEIVAKQHAALLAREAGRPSVAWRRYLMKRLTLFRDPEMEPILKKAISDKDKDVAYEASLGLLALGNHDGIDNVIVAARDHWSEVAPAIEKALPTRDRKSAEKLFTKIASARPTDCMAGLRLLRFLMTKEQGVLLHHYLQSSDFTVKKEAVNTARVLHGEEPIEKLTSFQVIKMAGDWLKKLN